MGSAESVLSLLTSGQTPLTRLFELSFACATSRTARPRAAEVYKQSFPITKTLYSDVQNLDIGTMTGVCIMFNLSATCIQMDGLD